MTRVLDKEAIKQSASLRTAWGYSTRPVGSTDSFKLPKSYAGDRLWFFSALILIDLAAIFAGFIGAGALWLGTPLEGQGIKSLTVVFPIFFAIAINNRAYSLDTLERPTYGIKRAAQALVYACAVGIAILFYLKVSEQFSRVVFAVGTLLSLATMTGARWLFGNLLGSRYRWTFRSRLVIVDEVEVTPHPGDCIVFAEHLGVEPGSDDPIMRHRLGEMLDRFDSVVLACPPERRRSWSYSLHGAAVDVELLMPELSRLDAVELRISHGERTLVVSSRPMGLLDRLLKRSLDLVVATLALVVVAPVMLVLAIAVKIESPGPVFFVQRRLGQNNRMFKVLKFRSMRADSDDHAGARSASRLDDRITPLGRLMRRTSLDELPQLLNVLKGEMSIVGPRPHALGSTAEDSLFWHIDRRYYQRHAIKPGITGLAQVRGFRGATDYRHDLTDRLQSDLEYVSGWTVWRDLKIIAGTFLVLVHPRAF